MFKINTLIPILTGIIITFVMVILTFLIEQFAADPPFELLLIIPIILISIQLGVWYGVISAGIISFLHFFITITLNPAPPSLQHTLIASMIYFIVSMLVSYFHNQRQILENLYKNNLNTTPYQQTVYSDIYQFNPCGILLFEISPDEDSFFLKEYNQTAGKLDKLTKSSLHQPIQRLFPEILQNGIYEKIHQSWKTGESAHCETGESDNHNLVYWRTHYFHRINDGLISWTYYDITDRKKMAVDLIEHDQTLQTMAHTTDDIILQLSFTLNPSILSANPSFYRHLGHAKKDYCGKKFYLFVHPDDKSGLEKILRILFLMVPTISNMSSEKSVSEKITLRLKDINSKKWKLFELKLAIINQRQLLCIARDISQTRKISDKLYDIQNQYDYMIKNLPLGVFKALPDDNLTIIWTNISMLRILDYDEESQLLNNPLSDRFWNYSEFESFHKKLSIQKINEITEFRMKKNNGQLIWCQLSCHLVTEKSGQSYIIGVLNNITDKKQIDNNIRLANNAKNEFLANMSHELFLPINTIIGTSSLLQQSSLDSVQEEYTQIVKTSADSLLRIINDIFNFLQIEAGKLFLEKTAFDLHQIMDQLLDKVYLKARHKKLRLNCIVAHEVSPALIGSPYQLSQILLNLTSNAIKYTEEGHITIRVDLITEDNSHCRLKFSVIDTGIGIPENARETILKSTGNNNTGNNKERSGLGLAIARRLTEMFGGSIDFDSVEGKGASFWVVLDFEKQYQPENESILTLIPLNKKRILTIDPDDYSLNCIEEYFKYWGCRFKSSRKGNESISLIKEALHSNDPYEIVLISDTIPDVQLEKFAQTIKQLYRNTPYRLILMSENTETEFSAELFPEQCLKPLRYNNLYQCLNNIPRKTVERESLIVKC